jgi:hypothetical protein
MNVVKMMPFVNLRITLVIVLMALIGLAVRVLFALAAYNDARSKNNPNAVMWGLLIGFLGFIPGIIYLCVRNSGRGFIVCPRCGISYQGSYLNCPKCGESNPANSQYVNPFSSLQAHRAKVYLTVALVLIGVGILLSVAGFMALLTFRFGQYVY